MRLIHLSPQGKRYYEAGPEDLRQGVLIIGQPGMGQESLLLSMLVQELHAGHGLALLDLHGRFLPQLLDYAASSHVNRLSYLDFADRQFPISYNLLEKTPAGERVLVKESLLVALRALFGASWGPRMEYILSYAIMALLECPGSTLFSLQQLLVDPWYRERVLKRVHDPFVRYFFTTEFDVWPDRFRQEAISPIQNKIGQFLLDPTLRHLVCQIQNKVAASELLQRRGILLARLPHAELGTTSARLLGTMLLVRLLQAATLPPRNHPHQSESSFSLYVPELHLLDSPGLASLLEQASESGIQLIASTPSLFALEDSLRQALLTHLRMVLAFRLSPDDARLLAKDAEPHYHYEDFINLGPGRIVFRPLKRGYPDRSYSSGYIPEIPPKPRATQTEKIIRVSRERYAIPRDLLAEKLDRHLAGTLKRVLKERK